MLGKSPVGRPAAGLVAFFLEEERADGRPSVVLVGPLGTEALIAALLGAMDDTSRPGRVLRLQGARRVVRVERASPQVTRGWQAPIRAPPRESRNGVVGVR
jgi:hypothetical protein